MLASPKLCGRWLNRLKGVKPVLPAHKPPDNIAEANFTGETRVTGRETVHQLKERFCSAYL